MQKQKLKEIASLVEELTPKNKQEELWINTTKSEIQNFLLNKAEKEDDFHISTLTQNFFTDRNLYSARPFVSTGYKKLDELITGFYFNEMTVIGGRPGMGKSTLAVNLLVNIARQNVPCLFLSYDNSSKLLTNKLISCISSIDTLNFKEDLDSEKEMDKLFDAKEELENLPIYLLAPTSERFPDFLVKLKSALVNKNIKVLFVDTLQLFASHHLTGLPNTSVNFVLDKLKKITNELGIATVLFSQLNRSVESRGGEKLPMLVDLRDSGTIEEIAEKIIFVYRPDYYGLTEDEFGNNTLNLMKLIIAKNRFGTLGEAHLRFLPHHSKILEDFDLKKNFGFDYRGFDYDEDDDL